MFADMEGLGEWRLRTVAAIVDGHNIAPHFCVTMTARLASADAQTYGPSS
jgi:hypothetical protein